MVDEDAGAMTKTKHTRGTEESARSNYAVAREIGAAITSSLVLEDVMQNVARRIAQALDVWECDLYEYDSESDTLVASAAWAPEMTQADLDWVGTVVNLSERPRYQEMIHDGAVIEDHIDDSGIDPTDRELMEEWGEKASLAVTLVHKDSPIGCLVLIEKRTARRFSDADKELVSLLSVPAAVAVHNARLFRRQEEQNRQLDSLLDSSQTLNSTVVLGDVLALVVRKATEALGCTYSILYGYDAVADTETSLAFFGPPGTDDHDEPIGTVFPLADYPDERVIIENRVVVEETISYSELSAPARASMAKWQ
jgi:transcriptional regulator with GAF, ATPase, and Fis domain